MPNFDGLVPDDTLILSELDFAPTFDPFEGFNVADNFAVLATANLIITSSGSYQFFLGSSDGSQLFIDGALLIDGSDNVGFSENTAKIFLNAGIVAIEVIEREREIA